LTDLLHELEPLTHDARIRRMVELGRAATHDQAVAATLEALGRGGTFERMLALHACHGSHDGAIAARAASDPSRLIRRRSLRRIALDRLLRGRPAEVADLLLGSEDTVALALSPVAHRLDDARLLALLERRPGALADRTHWFLRLSTDRRRAVFAAAGRSWRDA